MADEQSGQTEIAKLAPRLSKSEADRLLGEVAGEFFDRISQGERPEVEDYARRYPQIATTIRETFPVVNLMDASSGIGLSETPRSTDDVRHQQLGDFHILREIGRGGMGVVYEAEQISMGRKVALKVLPFAAVMDQRAITRFKNEARAAGTLHHPNIVPVHAVGNERGVYYYCMALSKA